MKKLTPRQSQVLDVIRSHTDETGFPPTRAEIADILGFRSANAAEEHLKALAKKGAIELTTGASRGIRIPDHFPAGIPVVGQVAAGNPILAEEHIEEHLALPEGLFSKSAHYLLRAKGLSMKDSGILDGDLLAIHKTTEVRNGQTVIARIDDEVTVKRFERKLGTVVLYPENPDFSPIEVDPKLNVFCIEGVVVGIIRQGLTERHNKPAS